ncbi:MAG TPA: DUF3443 family protein [Steroidobacteraceae bacterium]|nr:DUF3443 family protein [Steroidobacteraceae bacterium]
MRKLIALVLIPLVLAGCGGGGGGGISSGGSGGGGGGGGGDQTIATPGPPNVETITVNTGPPILTTPPNHTPAVNTAFVTVNICIAGTATCQQIPYVEVDTGSVGLRIISSVLTLNLQAETDTGAANGTPLAECLNYADGTTSWGPLYIADLELPVSGEKASSVNVQVMDSNAPGDGTVPTNTCTGTVDNTVVTFGANGILGVGPFVNDCNSVGTCPFLPGMQAANYYSCPTTTTCSGFDASAAQQLQNPVILFAKDNNGTIIELPAVAAAGAASASGSLVFGIGTESNNAIGKSVTQLFADQAQGFITATLNGTNYPDSYLDSGSNTNYFTSSIAPCPSGSPVAGFYCPNTITPVDVSLQGTDGTMAAADFDVANATALTNSNPTLGAFPDLGAPALSGQSMSVDLGLPFFFGRNVYTGIETAAQPSPYFAY